MHLLKPIRYRITFNPKKITSREGPKGEKNGFVSPASNEGPKLYIISAEEIPVYVGATKRPMGERMRTGFQSDGRNGYRGYLWRHYLSLAAVDIWQLELEEKDFAELKEDPTVKKAKENNNQKRIEEIIIETVEAEVVLLIQQRYGQWPKYQSEIHFRQSQETHREIARKVVATTGAPHA